MIQSMAQAWRRFRFPYEGERFRFLTACGTSSGVECCDESAVREAVAQLDLKRLDCPSHLDRDFTLELLPLARREPRRAQQMLADVLVELRVNSANVERSHLIGQSLNAVKSRGIGPAARTLSELT